MLPLPVHLGKACPRCGRALTRWHVAGVSRAVRALSARHVTFRKCASRSCGWKGVCLHGRRPAPVEVVPARASWMADPGLLARHVQPEAELAGTTSRTGPDPS